MINFRVLYKLSIIDDNRLLLVTGDGSIYVVSTVGEIALLTQGISVTPFDLQRNRITVSTSPSYLRITDALLEASEKPLRSLFVSYLHWDTEHSCVSLRLAEAVVDVTALGSEELDRKVKKGLRKRYSKVVKR